MRAALGLFLGMAACLGIVGTCGAVCNRLFGCGPETTEILKSVLANLEQTRTVAASGAQWSSTNVAMSEDKLRIFTEQLQCVREARYDPRGARDCGDSESDYGQMIQSQREIVEIRRAHPLKRLRASGTPPGWNSINNYVRAKRLSAAYRAGNAALALKMKEAWWNLPEDSQGLVPDLLKELDREAYRYCSKLRKTARPQGVK